MSGITDQQNKDLEAVRSQIEKWVDDHNEDILAFNRDIVSIPSINRFPTGEEKRVQAFVAKTLESLGCETDSFLPTDVPGLTEHPAYLGGRDYKDRPNVVGVKKGSGGGRSIMFSGHMDTVPEGEEPWTVPLFSGLVKDGKQYGLGLFDMKGGMAASMMALKAINELGLTLKGDVTIENVVDEEYGGANGTLACRLKGYKADIAIIPEPSNMVVCPENHGGSMMRIKFKGRAGRSFSGEKLLNPLYAAGRFLEIFREFEEELAEKTSDSIFYQNSPGLPAYAHGIKAGPVHLPLCDRVPGECTIDVWIQCYPNTTEEELRQEFTNFIDKKAANDEILQQMPPQIEKLIRFLPGSGVDKNHEILQVTQEVGKDFGEDLKVEGAGFACDAFMFNLHSDTPAIIWGPKGSNAHSIDEYIYVDDFMKLVKLYAYTMVKWCGIAK